MRILAILCLPLLSLSSNFAQANSTQYYLSAAQSQPLLVQVHTNKEQHSQTNKITQQTQQTQQPQTHKAKQPASQSNATNDKTGYNDELAKVYNLGVKAYNNKDFATARQHFLQASKQGHVIAKRYLGLMYINGEGVTRNARVAFNYFYQAAKANDAVSLYYVGRAYERGEGVTKNLAKAKSYYQKSASLGNNLANQGLQRLNEQSH
ncbi:hypothetical protein CKF54_04135 [Psittacicella hinzii]|uniref:Beta-lactamase n=1 Tax=Psittacicella hinzii TaxID=2028575 RepID=A0A3A1Y3B0_9GAMM|nr:tetratricopeptide repeat protein [Psittacicella hinzii]RIY32822.1 hypothetical protein CKF54_04135 [Psittacicella hinzii]